MIKLIASDMDGTLLNDHIEVSDANANAIKRAQREGIHFVIATGRDYPGGYPMVKEKGIECPFIGLNGAQYFDKDGKNVYNRGLEKKVVRQLMDIFSQYDIHDELMTNDGIYSDNKERRLESLAGFVQDLNPEVSFEEAKQHALERVEEMNVTFVSDYDDVIKDEKIVILKMAAHSNLGPEILAPLRKQIEAEIPNIVVTASSRRNIEINHVKAQKGLAVAEYAKKHGIKAHEVMTLGDNINDISMLKWAKYGTAMENAVPEAKEVASYSTSSNTHNGVADAISRVLRGKIYND